MRFQQSPPVDVYGLAHDLGLAVRRERLGKKISGKLVRKISPDGNSEFSIVVNEEDSPRRQRFTVAHEIAHFALHRDLIENVLVDDEMFRSSLGNHYETQANRLAADILMPSSLILRLQQSGLTDPAALARRLDVSEAAIRIRLDTIERAMRRPVVSHADPTR